MTKRIFITQKMSYSIKRYFSQNVKDQIFAEKAESQKNKFKKGGIFSRAEQIPPPSLFKVTWDPLF